jgi:uncharacterized protein with LGFP repeats/GH25 family lysozyme M1 (1,4-beta-N-acetylmuramidase)
MRRYPWTTGPLVVIVAAALLSVSISSLPATSGRAAAAGPSVSGPDVASWQHPGGASVDWYAVHGSGQNFAFVKATEDTNYRNPYFAADYAGIRAAGMTRGAYHYARPALPLGTAADQANFFVNTVGAGSQRGDLPLSLDLEEAGTLGPSDLIAWAHLFLDTVQARTGRQPILYTYPYYWRTAMANTNQFSGYPLWIADYNGGSGPRLPLVGGWTAWAFWQYTSTGTVAGIAGPIDLSNYCCGDAGLANLANGDTPVTGIIAYYYAIGGPGQLGQPTSGEYSVAGATAQDFERGTIYWQPTLTTEVQGAIQVAYLARGGPDGYLGLPATRELPTPDGEGRFNHFAGGSIYWTPPTGAHTVQGAIRQVWASSGWEAGPLGYPVTDELPTPDGIGRFTHFEHGSIYWTPGTGAHILLGAVEAKWRDSGWEVGPLGYPVSDLLPTPDGIGQFTRFERGSVYWTAATGAHLVIGAIFAKWSDTGWETGPMGYPVTDELSTGDATGRYTGFERGSIFWTPATGAHEVHGGIRDRWAATGWQAGPLGYPITDELPTPDGVGRFNHFEHGSVYWTPRTSAHDVLEPARAKWQGLGWETGLLGYPVADSTALPAAGSSSAVGTGFDGGRIYSSADTAAHEVHGAILATYLAMGGPAAVALGLPTSDEHGVGADRQSDFQRGSLRWSATTGAVALVPVGG